jgi:Fe-S-cluster containining protein
MTFTKRGIRGLLNMSIPERAKLKGSYALIPETHCHRRTDCCSLLPEMSLVEALSAIKNITEMDPSVRQKIMKKIVRYFFLNPIEISSCPFLEDKNCLIYEDRFFGCRVYGLWTREYYEKFTAVSRKVKEYIRGEWKKLGVSLPEKATGFQVPYCENVTQNSDIAINDEMLQKISEKVEGLSRQFPQWKQLYEQMYFSDLSFLITSLLFGAEESVQLKFSLVKEILATNDRTKVNKIIEELPDCSLE